MSFETYVHIPDTPYKCILPISTLINSVTYFRIRIENRAEQNNDGMNLGNLLSIIIIYDLSEE